MYLSKVALVALLSGIALSCPASAPPANAGKTSDAIAAGVVGAAIIAAASRHHRHHKNLYYDEYEYYPPEEYDTRWNNAYSPAPGIVCYRAQVACYKTNGHFSAKWTRMQFADGE